MNIRQKSGGWWIASIHTKEYGHVSGIARDEGEISGRTEAIRRLKNLAGIVDRRPVRKMNYAKAR